MRPVPLGEPGHLYVEWRWLKKIEGNDVAGRSGLRPTPLVVAGVPMTFLRLHFPVCQNCGKQMRIIRRGVRFDEGGYFERQEFTCAKCNGRLKRWVNTDGTVREHRQAV